MYNDFMIRPVIEPAIDLNALSHCVDMVQIDLHHSKPTEKLSALASSLFSFDVSDQWLFIVYYVRLPTDIVELIRAIGIRTYTKDDRGISDGFIAGTLHEYSTFVITASGETAPTKMRLIANQFYTFLNEKYKIFYQLSQKHLPDKTFTLK